MNTKLKVAIISSFIAIIFGIIIVSNFLKVNNVQNFQVIQSLSGEITVRGEGGWYTAMFPKIWTYPKVSSIFYSNAKDESVDGDGIQVVFSNKGTGVISSNVVVRLYTSNDRIINLHQYASGQLEIIENLILAKLKDISMTEASKITSSQAIENREELAQSIRSKILDHKELKELGIEVEQFSITSIDFDDRTRKLFQAQQEADLLKKTAEAEEQRLVMEKKKSIAEYDKQIAESEGRAKVEMVKQITDAERAKKLAEIEAQRKVEVEKLAKEEALVKASKLLEVAEVEKKTEAARLEVIKIQADQKVAEAQAKKQQIELSGAITEQEQFRLTIQKETEIGVAKAWATGISTMTLPKTVIVGGGENEVSVNPLNQLLNLLTVQKAEELSKSTK